MTCLRPGSLRMVVVCLLCSAPVFSQQTQPQPPQPPTQQPPPTQQQPPRPRSPFETVPTAPEQTQPPKLETPKPAVEAPKPASTEDTIGSITFRGARRTPQDMLRSLIQTRAGEKYDPDTLNRDFMTLWNTGRFEDIRLEREAGKNGWDITFVVTERRIIRVDQIRRHEVDHHFGNSGPVQRT